MCRFKKYKPTKMKKKCNLERERGREREIYLLMPLVVDNVTSYIYLTVR